MLYRSLGNTGLRVSEIGFGCASYWGKKVFDEAAAISLLHAAIDHGVTFFDTGASYSGGNAEPRLGRAISGLKNKHDLVIATKAGTYTDERGRWQRADAEHPYDVPCVIALPVVAANPAYAEWVVRETSGGL